MNIKPKSGYTYISVAAHLCIILVFIIPETILFYFLICYFFTHIRIFQICYVFCDNFLDNTWMYHRVGQWHVPLWGCSTSVISRGWPAPRNPSPWVLTVHGVLGGRRLTEHGPQLQIHRDTNQSCFNERTVSLQSNITKDKEKQFSLFCLLLIYCTWNS